MSLYCLVFLYILELNHFELNHFGRIGRVAEVAHNVQVWSFIPMAALE